MLGRDDGCDVVKRNVETFVGILLGASDGSHDGELDGDNVDVIGLIVGSVVGDGNGFRPDGQLPPVQLNPAAFCSLETEISSHVLPPLLQMSEQGALDWQLISKLLHASSPLQYTVTDVAPFGSRTASVQVLLPSQFNVHE